VAFMISSILLGKVAFYFVFALLVFLTLREFYTLSTADHIKPFHFYGSFIGVVIFTMFYIYCQKIVDEKIFLPLMPIILSFFLVELYRKNKHPFNNIAYTVFGIVYVCLPFSTLNFFVFEEINSYALFYPLLGFAIASWTNRNKLEESSEKEIKINFSTHYFQLSAAGILAA